MPSSGPSRVVVGITGASGAVYARGVIRALVGLDTEVHLVITPNGQRLLREELGVDGADMNELVGCSPHEVIRHSINDLGAPIASGTFQHRGMIVVPCSSNGLGMIAGGLGSNLLYRAALVTLKERRPLVLCHREMPISHIDIENMRTLTLAGAVIAPANPGWYLQPKSLDDITDFVVARLLDALAIEHQVGRRWGDQASTDGPCTSGIS